MQTISPTRDLSRASSVMPKSKGRKNTINWGRSLFDHVHHKVRRRNNSMTNTDTIGSPRSWTADHLIVSTGVRCVKVILRLLSINQYLMWFKTVHCQYYLDDHPHSLAVRASTRIEGGRGSTTYSTTHITKDVKTERGLWFSSWHLALAI